MTKTCYTPWSPNADSLQVVTWCNEIVESYQKQGYDLTVRQLYYRLVAADRIENNDKSYNRIKRIVGRARMAGLIDWRAIVDRTRHLRVGNRFRDPAHAASVIRDAFKLDRWEDQPCRVECWIEKDALVGVISPTCYRLDVPFFSCRGYTSLSAHWRAAQRVRMANVDRQSFHILHLADHDPSGLDMTHDLIRRFKTFGVEANVWRIALTMEQIEEYDPPPNFTKLSDSRSPEYVERFGNRSWELDALDPAVISGLVEKGIDDFCDDRIWEDMLEREQDMREELDGVVRELER